MTAVYSSTFDPKYDFFLPITSYCWSKLGVTSIIFIPMSMRLEKRFNLILRACHHAIFYVFECPKDKEATYAQCSRLYASSLVSEHEILVTTDADMLTFSHPPIEDSFFSVFGFDLVPEKQIPMCYVAAKGGLWDKYFNKGRTTQECLDSILGQIECESFAGNYWAKDQEELYNGIAYFAPISQYPRARPGTQFATNRLDRDDSFLIHRLSPEIFDYHMPRPGYQDNNFNQILSVLKYFYPDEDFQWLIDYRNEYIKLL